ncbi:type II toxin-antitoxin system HicB family antitoxin [Lapidilactobacillus bayanensis]|uniref:type II toxin-antitoxin system HicB family antitoxin n=1 Tax=Lapidilactobacillus bayanensis TaxID=2485998 RepID=UPI000F78D285|nr:type II toxin-antitoxin system HicB family antitoxin [Lapidilactobacillus bayanensis]
MKDKIVTYPVIIRKDGGETDTMPYLVDIPALDGMTEGSSIDDALAMAADYIGTYSLDEVTMPESVYKLPAHNETDVVSLVPVNISEYRRKNDSKVIKKTLSIPNYLNELGNERGVNFSLILTNALKKELNV